MNARSKVTARHVPRMGEIGEPQREVTFEPIPDTAPVEEPAAPVTTPEPERVPA